MIGSDGTRLCLCENKFLKVFMQHICDAIIRFNNAASHSFNVFYLSTSGKEDSLYINRIITFWEGDNCLNMFIIFAFLSVSHSTNTRTNPPVMIEDK